MDSHAVSNIADRLTLLTTLPGRRDSGRACATARCPIPGAVMSHSTASRPSAGVKARALVIVIFVPFAMVRSLPFRLFRTRRRVEAPRCGNTQDTPGNSDRFGVRKGSDRRAQSPCGLQALATTELFDHRDTWVGVGFLRLAAVGSHTPHSELLALPSHALAALVCSSTVRDAIHGLGKPDTKLRRARVRKKHMRGYSRVWVDYIPVTAGTRPSRAQSFPKDSVFSQGAHARAGP